MHLAGDDEADFSQGIELEGAYCAELLPYWCVGVPDDEVGPSVGELRKVVAELATCEEEFEVCWG